MAARRILLLGDPVLRSVSAPCDPLDTARILDDLRDTLHEFQRSHGFGRGISAVQIGEPVRLLYLEFEMRPYVLVNPRLTRLSDETLTMWDDCFSFPELMVRLRRSRDCEVEYQDEAGTSRHLSASGRLSELLQHEIDHLDGVLAVDRAIDMNSLMMRAEWARRHLPVVEES